MKTATIILLTCANIALVPSPASGYQVPKPPFTNRHQQQQQQQQDCSILSTTTSTTTTNHADTPHPLSRRNFHKFLLSTTLSLSLLQLQPPPPSNAFEGGVGGLGKSKPITGVTFANPDLITDPSSISTPGTYNAEIIGPDGITVLLSFYAVWPMLKSAGIESRDLANAESSFVQVATKPSYVNVNVNADAELGTSITLKKQFFVDSILGQTGKFGMYGTPTDVKVSKVESSSSSSSSSKNVNVNSSLYLLTFTTLTPGMREIDRKAYVSTKIIGDGVYMLVVGTALSRFKGQEDLLRKVADSFEIVEAPKSNFRR